MTTLDELRTWANGDEADRSPMVTLLVDELIERGWSTGDLARHMGGTPEQIATNELALDFTIACATERGVIVTEEWANDIYRGLVGTGEIFKRLHDKWRSRETTEQEPTR